VRRKNPYSLVDVNEVSVEAVTCGRVGQKAAVGVDVAKGELVVCVVWPDREFERPWRVKSPWQLPLVLSKLLELNRSCPVSLALESSGTYGDAFRQAADDAGLKVERVSAKAVKDDSESFDGVPSNHDGKDAAIIGTLCVNGRSSPWTWEGIPLNGSSAAEEEPSQKDPSQKNQAIRYWVRQLDTAQRIKQVWCGKLEGMLARHWPEAGRLTNQSGPTLTAALSHWGDPRALAIDPTASRWLAKIGGHYLSEEKIGQLVESARSTVGVRMTGWAAREMKDIASAISRERKTIQHCRRELKKLTRDHGPIQSQTPAVGLITACVLWMCLGDPQKYGSAGAYRKAMGLNLTERSSGQYKGKLKLSKRGQRLSRKWMYFAALRWMREPSVKPWLERKKQRDGGCGGKAATAIMRRLAAAAWHAGQGEVFDPRRLFPGSGCVVVP
jgi:transposase